MASSKSLRNTLCMTLRKFNHWLPDGPRNSACHRHRDENTTFHSRRAVTFAIYCRISREGRRRRRWRMRRSTVSRGGVTLSAAASRSTVIRYYGDGERAFNPVRCSSDRGYLHNPVHALVHSRECSIQRRSRARALPPLPAPSPLPSPPFARALCTLFRARRGRV